MRQSGKEGAFTKLRYLVKINKKKLANTRPQKHRCSMTPDSSKTNDNNKRRYYIFLVFQAKELNIPDEINKVLKLKLKCCTCLHISTSKIITSSRRKLWDKKKEKKKKPEASYCYLVSCSDTISSISRSVPSTP